MTEYEKEKELARSGNVEDRLKLASDPKTFPEVLYFLAEDKDKAVRQAVANNAATPRQADMILTKDSNTDIRSDLAVKLARITPHLPSDQRQKLYQLTEEALGILAHDQVLRVRQILADALKDVANAPRSVIKQLASDKELSIAEPILICSPVLSEKDLLQIISSDPIQGALAAIAQREEVSENLADIIIKDGDSEAVTYLLKNHRSAISERDLDRIVEQAEKVEEWHEPLVSRPILSPNSICRLATFVAMNLLDKLQDRMDMNDETLVAVAQTVESRIAKESEEEDAQVEEQDKEAHALEEAKRLMRAGALTQEVIEDALAAGNRTFIMASVSLLAKIDYEFVMNTLTKKNPQEIVALCWKADLSAHMAQQFQTQIALISPKMVIAPSQDSGAYTLTDKEMKAIIAPMPKAK